MLLQMIAQEIVNGVSIVIKHIELIVGLIVNINALIMLVIFVKKFLKQMN